MARTLGRSYEVPCEFELPTKDYLDGPFMDPEQADAKTGKKGPVARDKIKSRTEMKLGNYSLLFHYPV